MPEAPRRTNVPLTSLPDRSASQLSIRTLRYRHEAAQREEAHLPERRDFATREQLLQRVEREYREMPGLCLTAPQAERLFGLPHEVCQRVLDGLVAASVLRKDRSGRYARSQ